MEVLQDTVLPETDPVLSRDSLTRLRHAGGRLLRLE